MRRLVVLAMLVMMCSGCYTMKHAAPPGGTVSTISVDQPATVKRSVKVWYALWGAVPISNNSSERIISENNLKEARVVSRIKFEDYLISIFTGLVSIVPATMTVEGNQ